MSMKTINQILDELSAMEYDKRVSFAYFCAGMLYGMSVLDVDDFATVRLTETEEETV